MGKCHALMKTRACPYDANHADGEDEEGENTTHANVIVDDNEGETEGETEAPKLLSRTRTSKTKPQKAKTTITTR